MKTRVYAGIDVGGTKISAALVADSGKILSRAKLPSEKNSSPSRIIKTVAELIEENLRAASVTKRQLAGIGVGIPGLLDPASGKVIKTPNLNLSGVNLQKQLRDRFKIKVAVGNDANLGLLGEKWVGAARSAKNAVGLFLGTGIGGGVIVNNSLISGFHGAAAELGHMQLDAGGPKCTCGNVGCLEAFGGRWALERDIKAAIAEGERTIVTKIIDGKIKNIKSRVLRKALKRKDPLVSRIVREASLHIGGACVTLRHIFDPELFIFGGGVVEACGDFMLPVIQKTIDKDRFFASFGQCRVVPSKLGDDAVILGGVALVRGLS
jgi:glucokinase